jgi:hypothetical protein
MSLRSVSLCTAYEVLSSHFVSLTTFIYKMNSLPTEIVSLIIEYLVHEPNLSSIQFRGSLLISQEIPTHLSISLVSKNFRLAVISCLGSYRRLFAYLKTHVRMSRGSSMNYEQWSSLKLLLTY